MCLTPGFDKTLPVFLPGLSSRAMKPMLSWLMLARRKTLKQQRRKLSRLGPKNSFWRYSIFPEYRSILIFRGHQDLKREFVEELIYPAVQANAIYEVCLVLMSMGL